MAVMTALAIAGLVATTVSMVQQQRAARRQADALEEAGEAQERIGEDNAVEAERDALDASRRGVEESGMLQRDVRARSGANVAGYGAQGVDVTTGTPLDVRTGTEALLQSDLARVRRNAEREAMGYKSEARNYRLGGQYARRAAQNQARATVLTGWGAAAAYGPSFVQGGANLYAAAPRAATPTSPARGWQ